MLILGGKGQWLQALLMSSAHKRGVLISGVGFYVYTMVAMDRFSYNDSISIFIKIQLT